MFVCLLSHTLTSKWADVLRKCMTRLPDQGVGRFLRSPSAVGCFTGSEARKLFSRWLHPISGDNDVRRYVTLVGIEQRRFGILSRVLCDTFRPLCR
jgi:hypothetical protein